MDMQGVSAEAAGVDIWQPEFTVKTYECGPEKTIRLPALMQHMQEAAATHAEQLGFGIEKLEPIHSFWVLWNLRIGMQRLPQWNEVYTIRTWPSSGSRVVATREFVGMDRDGNELFTAGSQWMVVNQKNRIPRNLCKLDIENLNIGPATYSAGMERLEPRGDYQIIETMQVPHSAIDMNGHVNNTEYVHWTLDGLVREGLHKESIRTMQIIFLSEVFESDIVSIRYLKEKATIVASIHNETGQELFLMQVDIQT
ncbi:MAG: hypothetical protein JXA82_13375 [Sedimentisphaerales bacterium]|nr:hypothetical protein [Sedimentisphaerales bacterium]